MIKDETITILTFESSENNFEERGLFSGNKFTFKNMRLSDFKKKLVSFIESLNNTTIDDTESISFHLEQIELNGFISTTGKIGIIGLAGADISLQSGIKLVFKMIKEDNV